MKDKNIKFIFVCFAIITAIIGCATTKELQYIRKDHFMVGKYEVGAIEYVYKSEEIGTIKWSFPVYKNSQKIKTYHFLLQMVPEFKIQMHKMESSHYYEKEWVIQEESINGDVKNVKSYYGVLICNYEFVKGDVIKLIQTDD